MLYMRCQRTRFRSTHTLHLEALEERRVLSAMGLVDCPAVDLDHDSDLHGYDANGYEYHALPAPELDVLAQQAEQTGGLDASSSLTPAESLTETFLLNSNLGAAHTIYLDFTGEVTSGTSWNSSFNGGEDIVTPEYDFTGEAGFSDTELQRIQYIWQRVAEDFAPFDVNVTTEDPGQDALVKSGGGDAAWGVRVVIGGNGNWYKSGVGGVAYVGSFNWSSDTPVFVFENNLGNGHEKYTTEAISHEAGHALGLSHDGSNSTAYYQGHGSGETGWAPIMGVGYYQNLVQWSQGEYPNANNTQDDLAIITGNNGFGYRADDHGDSSGTSSLLVANGDLVSGSGIIETNTDVDVFTFTTDVGLVDLNFSPAERGANLDILAELYDDSGALVASANPTEALAASMNLTLDAGQYYLHISGTGLGDPLNGGYTDYGSLGQYTIDGTVVGVAGSDSLAIAAADAQKAEGDAGTTGLTFQVTRSGDISGESSVDWTVAGADVDAADFAGGVIPSGTLTFAGGESAKTITVNVQGDLESESDEGFVVQLSNASAGTFMTASTAAGTILNDDVPPTPPGITVTPTSGLTTTEAGGTATFSVVLDAAPTADVVITVTSLDTTEGEVNKSTLTFTSENWDTPQTVTVIGVDDTVRDRNQTFTVELGAAQSGDAGYAGLAVDDVLVTNQDNERGNGGGGNGNPGGGNGKGKKTAGADRGEISIGFGSSDTSHVGRRDSLGPRPVGSASTQAPAFVSGSEWQPVADSFFHTLAREPSEEGSGSGNENRTKLSSDDLEIIDGAFAELWNEVL